MTDTLGPPEAANEAAPARHTIMPNARSSLGTCTVDFDEKRMAIGPLDGGMGVAVTESCSPTRDGRQLTTES